MMNNHKPPSTVQQTGPAPAKLDLHIDSLVLDGVPDVRGEAVRQSVRQALARVFQNQGIPSSLSQGGDIAHLDGGVFSVAPGADAQTIGTQIAQAIYRGLTP
jgi:hypothetical protein